MTEDLGHRLAMARHGQRISQVDLARQVGITQKHLSQIETSARPFLSLACGTLMRLAKVLHVTTDYLLGMDEDDAEDEEEDAVALPILVDQWYATPDAKPLGYWDALLAEIEATR